MKFFNALTFLASALYYLAAARPLYLVDDSYDVNDLKDNQQVLSSVIDPIDGGFYDILSTGSLSTNFAPDAITTRWRNYKDNNYQESYADPEYSFKEAEGPGVGWYHDLVLGYDGYLHGDINGFGDIEKGPEMFMLKEDGCYIKMTTGMKNPSLSWETRKVWRRDGKLK